MKKVIFVVLTMLMIFLVNTSIYAETESKVILGKEARVFVSGNLGEKFAGDTVTFLVTEKGASLASLTREQIYHIAQFKTDETGDYKLFSI